MSTVHSADGTPIAFDAQGEGHPLILVDGATSYRAVSQLDAEVGKLLRDRFRVYAYDRRGRGESGDTAPYAVRREIEDLAALIEDAGAPALVCGFSSGAILALDAAAAGLPITGWRCSSRRSWWTEAARHCRPTTSCGSTRSRLPDGPATRSSCS